MKRLWLFALLLIVPIIATKNAAPTVNITGTWNATFFLPNFCALHDTMTVVQTSNHFVGIVSGKLLCSASFNTSPKIGQQITDSIINGTINGNTLSFDFKPVTIDSLDFLLAHQHGTIGDGMSGTLVWVLRGQPQPAVIYPFGGSWTATQP